ncbi:hypothetical protein TSUD_271630 [Trifolium subterraneum]|uniref:O-methyltransferase domain-containing protein n=1 Tax=Trifolium subterraneum TaxID=3900 RepID=A0A2Z6NA14_TRISU|nr:hypothetical protein TSUD_271630 [Trifolium subterraneum]
MTQFTDSFALKAVVELRIADIIDRYGKPLSLTQIVQNLDDAPSPDSTLLLRVMRVMVRRKIFSAEKSETGEILYGLTRASKWILQDTKLTLAPMLLLENHPFHLNPANYISEIVREGTKDGTAFFRCHGHEQFEMTGLDAKYNDLFNQGMILKNCRKAIPEKTGKVIIVDHVLDPEGSEPFTDTGIAFDMMLLAHNAGGKERTEENWQYLFKETGFPRYNIIKINALPSIIEAFPI